MGGSETALIAFMIVTSLLAIANCATIANMQKGFVSTWLVIGLIIAVLVAGGGYWIYKTQVQKSRVPQDQYGMPIITPSQTPETNNKPTPNTKPQNNEAANWKTYINSQYGFTVMYPTNWTISQVEPPISVNKPGDSAPLFYVAAPGYPTPGVGLDGVVDFFIYKYDNSLSLLDWVKKNGYNNGSLPDNYYQSVTINGYSAVKINFIQTQDMYNKELSGAHGGPLPIGYKATYAYINKGDLIFEVQAGKMDSPDDFLKEADQIISNFKFN